MSGNPEPVALPSAEEDYLDEYCYRCQRLLARMRLLEAGVTEPAPLEKLQKVIDVLSDEMRTMRERVAVEQPELSDAQVLSVCVVSRLAVMRVLLDEVTERLGSAERKSNDRS